MATEYVQTRCPSCGTEVVAAAAAGFDDGQRRLTGEDVQCDGCGGLVGVYCY